LQALIVVLRFFLAVSPAKFAPWRSGMALSLSKALLHREMLLDKKKRPISNGKKAAYIREQLIDSSGRVVKTKTRDFSAEEDVAVLLDK
jgi:hypothetical protein